MNRKIVNFIFIQDAFGPIPVWTLQHPIHEADEAYLIQLKDFKDKPEWFKILNRLWKLKNLTYKESFVTPYDIANVTITGKLKYHYDKKLKCNSIDDLIIEYWTIEGTITNK